MNSKRFLDHHCIVFGANGGIGKAVMRQLEVEGARQVTGFTYFDDKTPPDKSIDRSNNVNIFNDVLMGNVLRMQGGLFGSVDVIINCAGIMSTTKENDPVEQEMIMNTNFYGAHLICKHGIPIMSKARSGAIVHVTSIHSQRTQAHSAFYAASKAAIEAYTRAMIQQTDIRINCVAPGAVDTPMLRRNPNITFDNNLVVNTPEAIAEVICFMASNESRAINGSVIIADSGVLVKL